LLVQKKELWNHMLSCAPKLLLYLSHYGICQIWYMVKFNLFSIQGEVNSINPYSAILSLKECFSQSCFCLVSTCGSLEVIENPALCTNFSRTFNKIHVENIFSIFFLDFHCLH